MPTTVWPSDPMNSFGAYVASAATVSVPFDLIEAGTWAAIELTALDGVVDDAAGLGPELLRRPRRTGQRLGKPQSRQTTFADFCVAFTGTPAPPRRISLIVTLYPLRISSSPTSRGRLTCTRWGRWSISGLVSVITYQLMNHGHTVGMRYLRSDHAVRAAARRLSSRPIRAGLGQAVAAYYTEPAFAGMTFSNLGRNPRDEITADDLLAVSLLDITWRPEVVRILLGSQQPGTRRPCSQHSPTTWISGMPMTRCPNASMSCGTRSWRSTASAPPARPNLLARKRPRLCPISDSVVIKAIGVPQRTWDVLRCLLQDQAARAQVEALRPAVAADASLLRILDVILWITHSESAAAQWVREESGMAGRVAAMAR